MPISQSMVPEEDLDFDDISGDITKDASRMEMMRPPGSGRPPSNALPPVMYESGNSKRAMLDYLNADIEEEKAEKKTLPKSRRQKLAKAENKKIKKSGRHRKGKPKAEGDSSKLYE